MSEIVSIRMWQPVNNGAKGFLVLTGETKAEDVEKSSVRPDAVFESLGEMKGYL